MAYEKYTWQDGDYLTTARMNHIEDAIEQLSENPISQEELTAAIDTAVGNIGADSLKAVSYDIEQNLTEPQRIKARTNIGAAAISDLDNRTDVKIRVNKSPNSNNIEYPVLVSQTGISGIENGDKVEAILSDNNSNNPTVNYSTGTLKANNFVGNGSQLTNIQGSAIENLNASKIVAGEIPIARGGTGATTAEGARAQLKALTATDLVDAFDSSRTYQSGDFCVYNDQIWRYTGEDPSSGQWDEVSVNWASGAIIANTVSSLNRRIDATVNEFGGATSEVDGTEGLVPAPQAGDEGKFLGGDGTWHTVDAGVTGVKGNNENVYRTGQVNLTPANLGAASAENLADAISAIAEQYDEEIEYNTGNYCIYNNKLYRCIDDEVIGQQPDAENSEYWEEATVMSSIVDVATNLNPESIGAASVTDLAAEYNSSTEYEIGDYCIYENHLYKCTTAIDENGESWNSEHWTATTVDEAMGLAAQAAAAAVSGVVRYDQVQSLGEAKAVARANIGAADENVIGGITSSINTINSTINGLSYVKEVTQSNGELKVKYKDDHVDSYNMGLIFNGGFVDENNYLYLKNGETTLSNDVFTPILLPATGGGGGGGGPTISLSNVTRTTSARNGKPCPFSLTVTASDDSDITINWSVNGAAVLTQQGYSGSVYNFDAKDYLTPSTTGQSVVAAISSSGGGSITRSWTVETIAFGVEWGASINPIMLYTTNNKVTVPIIVSQESGVSSIITVNIGSTDITRTVTGARTISVELDSSLFTTGINVITASMVSATDNTDTADDIYFTAIWGYGASTPVVAFANATQTCAQYDVVNIDYFVYDPNNETATCTIQVGSGEPQQLSVTRTIRTYQYAATTIGAITITLACGNATATMTLTVTQSEYNITYVTEGLNYCVDPVGHSNSDSDKASFGSFTFSNNFDWVNGGFQQDENGATAFVVKKGDTVTLPHSLFVDSDTAGKTIDISFKITNSEKYDAVAIKDLNSSNIAQASKGIILRANNGEIRLNNIAGQEFRYCEESRIDLSILIEATGTQRIMTVWLDGIPSKVNEYSANMLVHDDYATIIGSDYCDVWIYNIRTYNMALSKQDMIQNYISNGNTTNEKISRYTQNTILNQNDKITKAALHTAVPNLTIIEIQMPKMTTNKKDNVPSTVIITDGANELVLPPATGPDTKDGTVVKVQGTSSAAYGRSAYNLDIDFKNTDKKYKISSNSIAVNYLNVKVNVASSENANNINAVDWYNTYQPYLLPYRNTTGIRDTVEGKPCAVFVTNNSNESKWFSSQYVAPNETILYAMGDLCNSKKNTKVFAEGGPADENDTTYTKACIEVSGNDTQPQRFRSMTGVTYNAEDGEWQTTETVVEDGETKTKKIKHFEWRMEPSNTDKPDVIDAWEDTVNWVISTIGDSATFKSEVEDYFSIDSLLYHFLFIEYFAAYDNVSKNTFYSFDYDPNADSSIWGGYRWNINKAYDMDTILAADNDGKPLGDYGVDYGDLENGRSLFNAVDNPIWVNIKAAFQTELANMYTSLRSAGAWNSSNIITKWDTYQHKRPQAAMVVDAYNKYIQPYKTNGVDLGDNEGSRGYDDSYLPRLQGSKTYWRRQFLTYQTSYMDGKYLVGTGAKGSAINFRTNCESNTYNFTVKAYAKTYITAIVDDNKVNSLKVNAGGTVTFQNVSVGANTTLYFAPERLIQYVIPLNQTLNSTFGAAGAAKLMEANLGGESTNIVWPSGTGVNIPSVLLKELSIRNMTNFTNALDLSPNVELEELDTRGTQAGIITLPVSAPLTSIQLNACTGISAKNLNDVSTFTMASGENLVSVQIENCNSTISNALATYLVAAVNAEQTVTRRLRAINVNWSFNNYNILYKLATEWKGYNNLGEEQNNSVLTGTVTVPNITQRVLDICNNIWPNLTINYTTKITEYKVTFLNANGDPILDKNGNEYAQYIEQGSQAYDPITAGEINTPTMEQSAQYTYLFSSWNNLTGVVNAPKTVTAVYTETTRTYTIRWFDGINTEPLTSALNVAYGSAATYNGTYPPTITDYEASQMYYVFLGWDKSTSYVTGNTDVYATWSYSSSLPAIGTELKDMSLSDIYGIAASETSGYWTPGDYYDIQVGRDYNYSNVESQTLISTPTYFDGTAASVKIFNGENGLPAIELFDENSPSFTLAIDYEFTDSSVNTCLASCGDGTDGSGFRLRYETNPTLVWGNDSSTIGNGFNRNILVIRHNKTEGYTRQLIINYHNNNSYYVDTNLSNVLARSGSGTYTTDGYLVLGGAARYYNNTWQTSVLGKGWIHWCKIWYQDLGDNDCQELACWPHEIWRMEYTGPAKWTDEYTHNMAEFFLNNPLSLKHTIGTPANMSNFFNKVYKALPVGWRTIIKDVSIKTITSYNNNSPVITTSTAKLYIPSIAEIDSNYAYGSQYTQELNNNDQSYIITTLTEDKERIKFPGVILDDVSYIEQSYINNNSEERDPTNSATQSNPVISGKTIWLRTDTIDDPDLTQYSDQIQLSKVGYIYFDKNYCDTHKVICGRPVNDSRNINATGANYIGGKWIMACTWWTRTLTYNDSYYYYKRVKPNGSTNTNNWYDSYGHPTEGNIAFAFSI